ncbi:hypothetical protein AHAS_Ahas08G0011700 [Arachis hypogaea]
MGTAKQCQNKDRPLTTSELNLPLDIVPNHFRTKCIDDFLWRYSESVWYNRTPSNTMSTGLIIRPADLKLKKNNATKNSFIHTTDTTKDKASPMFSHNNTDD